MLVKGLVLTAVLASTPLAIVVTQDPQPPRAEAAARAQALQQQQAAEFAAAREQLQAAREELQRLRAQLERALDALDRQHQPQRERNCAPSRGRALMSHYQWLRDEGHRERAAGTLAKVVDQVGADQHQRNSVAWGLMTDKETAGRFDDVALAIAQRMEQGAARDANHLDTIALAHFLNGKFDRAVALQQQAIAAGGHGDEARRRLRTYEAARDALAESQGTPAAGSTLIAANDDDDD
jgi:Skp family chaperone for outer membrane proteins